MESEFFFLIYQTIFQRPFRGRANKIFAENIRKKVL